MKRLMCILCVLVLGCRANNDLQNLERRIRVIESCIEEIKRWNMDAPQDESKVTKDQLSRRVDSAAQELINLLEQKKRSLKSNK